MLYLYENTPHDELPARLRDARIDPTVAERILTRVRAVAHKSDVFPDYCRIGETYEA